MPKIYRTNSLAIELVELYGVEMITAISTPTHDEATRNEFRPRRTGTTATVYIRESISFGPTVQGNSIRASEVSQVTVGDFPRIWCKSPLWELRIAAGCKLNFLILLQILCSFIYRHTQFINYGSGRISRQPVNEVVISST